MGLKIRYILNHGEIGVFIDKVKYVYFVDAGFLPKIEKLARRTPGKALNFLKEVSRECRKEVTQR